jgi:glucose/arabinose dehydrogenase
MRAIVLMSLFASSIAFGQTPPADLTLSTFIPSGVGTPMGVRNAEDGSNRIFIMQRDGVVRVYENGALLATPLVSITTNGAGERGLLGLAFHPNYDGVNERRFYMSYTIPTSFAHGVVEFQTQVGNRNVADVGSRREVISVPDIASNHNGGDLHFGPDGFLYWSIGDGGPQNDPHGFAQCLWKKNADNNPSTCGTGANFFLLGKILRIDPTPTASATAEMCAATQGQPAGYSIPPSNPFVGTSNTCDEIVHYGMRNPYRFNFDRENGDMYVGDVGQGTWEETTRIPAGTLGANLGWRCFEGHVAFNSTGPCANALTGYIAPFQSYEHISGRCSITGGYRYRGPIPGLRGMHISADYCTGEIYFSSRDAAGTWTPAIPNVNIWRDTPDNIIGFGEDEAGNVYVTNQGGSILRFSSASANDLVFRNGFE